MTALSPRLLVLCLLPAALALPLRAQPGESPPRPATLRFLFLDETPGGYALKIDRRFQPISSGPYTISPPYTPATTGPLDLYKTSARRDPATGEFPRLKVTSFTPPADTTSALVIVTPQPPAPGSSETPACHVEIIDDSPAAFPGGALRLLNRGRVPLAARLAGDRVVIDPGSARIITPATDPRGRLRVLVAVPTPGHWKLIDDNVVIVTPGTRVTGILVYSPSGLKFRLGPQLLAERGDPPPSHVWLTYTDTP